MAKRVHLSPVTLFEIGCVSLQTALRRDQSATWSICQFRRPEVLDLNVWTNGLFISIGIEAHSDIKSRSRSVPFLQHSSQSVPQHRSEVMEEISPVEHQQLISRRFEVTNLIRTAVVVAKLVSTSAPL